MGNTTAFRSTLHLGILVWGFLSLSCVDGPLEPIGPTWDVSLTMPVLQREHTLGELFPGPSSVTVTVPVVALCDTVVVGDTTGDGTADKRLDRQTVQDMSEGRLHIEVTNGIAMRLAVKATFLDLNGSALVALPKAVADSFYVPSAEVTGGEVVQSTVKTQVFELSAEDIRQFNEADLVRYFVTLATPDGQVVNYRSSHSFRIRMWAVLSYRVNG